jgi:signal transduction histidine kinase
MIERMHNYAADMSQAKDIVLRFESDQSLNALRFSLEFRKNIYLIFKEAMNNAAKYSKAKTIDVTLQLNGNLIRMVVRDNGEGFDEALIRHGNGIKNMFSRAKAIGASFELSSAVGEGTVISLTWGKHP